MWVSSLLSLSFALSAVKTASEATYIVSSGALNSTPTNQPCLLSSWKLFTVATFGPVMEQLKLFARREDDKHLCSGFICQFRCRCNSHVYLTETSRAAVETEFLSPDPYPWGCPYPWQSPGLPWRRNLYPNTHTHGDAHTHAESRAAVGTEFVSPYPCPWGCPYPCRVQGCRGDGISIPRPIPMGMPIPMQSPGLPWRRNFYPHTHVDPIPTADLETRRNFEEFIDGRFTVTVTVVNND